MKNSKTIFIVEMMDGHGEFQPASNHYFHTRDQAVQAIDHMTGVNADAGRPTRRYRVMEYQRIQNNS